MNRTEIARDSTVSLTPLTPEQALRALLALKENPATADPKEEEGDEA